MNRFLSLCLLLAASAASAADPQTVLLRAKEAAGGDAWDRVRTLHVAAEVATGGLTGKAESWDDVAGCRFTDSFALGPISGAGGFDGTSAWSQDSSGETRRDEGGEGKQRAANESYRRCLGYWYPERRKAEITAAGDRQEGGRTFHVVTIHPEGGRPFDLWIDGATWLIDRIVEPTPQETSTTYFSDYRTIDGLRIAGKSRTTNGEAKYDTAVTVTSIEVNPAVEEARFAVPRKKAEDFSIAEGRATTTVPFELLNNHIYVEIRLDGKGPLHVIFDTGGMNVVTPAVAEHLGLTAQGTLQARGAGEKTEDGSFAKVGKLALGDAVLTDQVFLVLPLAGLDKVEGTTVDGLIGFEVFKRFVVRVDYAARRLTLTLPSAFTPPADATAVPFTFEGQTPHVDGTIDGIPGKLTIDTGSRASLTLHRPFAEANDFKGRYRPKVETTTGFGLGGPVRGAVSRTKLVTLGSVEVPGPVTEMALVEKGAFMKPHVAANVGGGILRRFTVTFDYAGKRIFFAPNAGYAVEDPYDRAGLWLNQGEQGFKIEDVVAGSPAAEAGLAVGDEILALDGKSVTETGLSAVRDLLKRSPAGTKIRATVRRGEATRDLDLVLRDLL